MSKRILIISHALNRSGAPMALLQLVKSRSSKNDADIFLLGLRYKDLEYEFAKYVKEVYIVESSPAKNLLLDIFQRLKAIPKIVKYIAKVKPDIVLINSAANSRAIVVSKILQKKFNYKIIVYMHEFKEMFRVFGNIRVITISLADKVIVVNKEQISWLKSKILTVKNIKVIPNSINKSDVEKLLKAEPENDFLKFINKFDFLISNIGIMTQRKGYDLYARIIADMSRYKDIGFVIIGDFAKEEDKNTFLKIVNENKLLDRVYITGITDNVFKYLKYTDVTAITSRSETFSRVALESMMLGKPVVAFDIPALRHVLPRNYPFFVKAFNTEEFIDKLIYIKNENRDSLDKLKKELVLQADNFSTEKIAKIFWDEINA